MSAIRILPYAIPALTAVFLAAIILLARLDRRKNRAAPGSPLLSVVIPAFNHGGTLPEAIESLFRSYDPDKLELVVVDDASTDATAEVLARLRKRYRFEVLAKTRNEGKAGALNDGCAKTRGELVLVLDADTSVTRPILEDLLGRLRHPRVGAASSRYLVANRGFLPRMTGITYAMLAFTQAAQNSRSCLSLWGGCMMFKRAALEAMGEFRSRMLLEDMDAALRLGEGGWKVEQAWTAVGTRVPARLADWIRQQVRWAAGLMQILLTYPRSEARNPFFVIGAFVYWSVSAGAVLALLLPGIYGFPVAAFLAGAFMLLSLPLAFASAPGKKWGSAPLVIPYTLVFFPLQATVVGIAFVIGIFRFFSLRRGGRAW